MYALQTFCDSFASFVKLALRLTFVFMEAPALLAAKIGPLGLRPMQISRLVGEGNK